MQLQKEFELEKSELLQRHQAELRREAERSKEQTEASCKQVYMQEMKKLGQEHKEKLTQAKRKQWVSSAAFLVGIVSDACACTIRARLRIYIIYVIQVLMPIL